MEDQITLRISREMSRALTRRARELGVPKSRLVREAIANYLVGESAPTTPPVAERPAPFLGTVRLDRGAIEQDAITQRVRRQNWRD